MSEHAAFLTPLQVNVLLAVARAGKPPWVKEVSRALGLDGWQEDERVRHHLAVLEARGLVVKSGAYRKVYAITAAGGVAAERLTGSVLDTLPKDGTPVQGPAPRPRPYVPRVGRDLFDPVVFGRHLKHEIAQRNCTLVQVGAAVGCSAAMISRVENGERPSLELFLRLLAWSGVSKFAPAAFSGTAASQRGAHRDVA